MKAPAVFTLLYGATFAAVVIDISKNLEAKSRLILRAAISQPLRNNFTLSYLADFTVGTPPQKVVLVIDTWSSDVWMPSSSADGCVRGGCLGKSYNPSKSSTYKLAVAKGFAIGYGDDSNATGDYIIDNLSFGGVTIKSLEMGLGFGSSVDGIAGIGYASNEASVFIPSNDSTDPHFGQTTFQYPSIIDTMVNQGFINTRAYSIYLNSRHSSAGSIVFGGLDTTKYHGNLIQLPIVPTPLNNGTEAYKDLQIRMTAFSISWKNGTTDNIMHIDDPYSNVGPLDSTKRKFPRGSNATIPQNYYDLNVVLDTGSTICSLPFYLVSSIVSSLGGSYGEEVFDDTPFVGVPFVDCDLRKQKPSGTFNFGFSDNKSFIKVPFKELILDLNAIYDFNNSTSLPKLPFKSTCTIAVEPRFLPPFILGDSFMRSAYVVFDLKNNLIGMAPTNFHSNASKIVDFPKDMSRIPDIAGVSSTMRPTRTGSKTRMITRSAKGTATGVPKRPTGISSSTPITTSSTASIAPTSQTALPSSTSVLNPKPTSISTTDGVGNVTAARFITRLRARQRLGQKVIDCGALSALVVPQKSCYFLHLCVR